MLFSRGMLQAEALSTLQKKSLFESFTIKSKLVVGDHAKCFIGLFCMMTVFKERFDTVQILNTVGMLSLLFDFVYRFEWPRNLNQSSKPSFQVQLED